jgi:hypothetical protein
MKLRCKYCKIVHDFDTWEEIQKENRTQCWVTVKGVNHHFNELVL